LAFAVVMERGEDVSAQETARRISTSQQEGPGVIARDGCNKNVVNRGQSTCCVREVSNSTYNWVPVWLVAS